MTVQITVSAKGDKTYSVLSNIPRPTKTTRERDPSKAVYPFNTMQDNDFLYVATEQERNAMTQAFKSKIYAEANKRGYPFTRNLAKMPEILKALGKTEGFGFWFTAYTPEELAANEAAEKGEKA